MNIMLLNPEKNYDKAVRELKKEKANEKTVVRELKKAYGKELANGLLAGAIVGLAIFGAITIVQNVRENISDEE